MIPRRNEQPAIDIEPFLMRHLEPLLRTCGFDIRSTAECNDFIKILQNFIKFICQKYSIEIVHQLGLPENEKTKEELISWTVSELCALQAVTFHKFERLISVLEMTNSGPGIIDCRVASTYSHQLSDIYQSAVLEWKKDRSVEPLRTKHQKKRRNRKWAPYFVEIFFNE